MLKEMRSKKLTKQRSKGSDKAQLPIRKEQLDGLGMSAVVNKKEEQEESVGRVVVQEGASKRKADLELNNQSLKEELHWDTKLEQDHSGVKKIDIKYELEESTSTDSFGSHSLSL